MKYFLIVFFLLGSIVPVALPEAYFYGQVRSVPPTVPVKTYLNKEKFHSLGFSESMLPFSSDIIDIEKFFSMELEGSKESQVRAELKDSRNKRLHQWVISKKEGEKHKVFAAFPQAGKYELIISGKRQSDQGWHPLFIYKIKAYQGTKLVNFQKEVKEIEAEVRFAAAGSPALEGITEGEYQKMYRAESENEVFEMLKHGASENHVDIVILGDGYNKEENEPGGSFESHAIALIDGLFKTSPFKENKTFFNVHRVRCVSPESGATIPGKKNVNNLFGSAYGRNSIDRLVYPDKEDVLSEYVNKAPDVDIVFILVNENKYGGAGYGFYTSLNGENYYLPAPVYAAPVGAAPYRVSLHELGHSFGGLADEYEDPYSAKVYAIDRNKDYINADFHNDLTQISWKEFFKYPGYKGIVGAYEGALYHSEGIYRPQKNCMMRSTDQPFCEICKKQLTRKIYENIHLKFDEAQYFQQQSIVKKNKNVVVKPNTKLSFPEQALYAELARVSSEEKDIQAEGKPFQVGNIWKLNIKITNGKAIIIYNPVKKVAHYVPWWNYAYLNAHPEAGIKYPTSGFYFEEGTGWVQEFDNGKLILPPGTNDTNDISFKPFTSGENLSTFHYKDGRFELNTQKIWKAVKNNGSNYVLEQSGEDQEYFYLKNSDKEIYIALPKDKKIKFFWLSVKSGNEYQWKMSELLP